jgi:hypothetical protein
MSNKQNDALAKTMHDAEIEKQSHPENFEWPEMRKWQVTLKVPNCQIIVKGTTAEDAVAEAESQLESMLEDRPNYLDIQWSVKELLNIKGETK